MSDTEIRVARAADGTALAELDHREWSTLHAITPRPPADRPFFDRGHPPEHYLVSEREGRVTGYVRVVQDIPFPSGDHVRQIQGLVVDSSERGRGVGRALVDAACVEAVRQGARRITLRVLGWNAGARRLYEAAGFAVEGVMPGEFYIDGQYVDDVIMGRPLPS
ncbi:GNAT family N-acetyltransferase [Actinomadura barringtoniae]|uniref:GNAT family N-acetyltransferase n=1 Tax=Actinomadura barringtoniae TaxID=1427535 RepID=UPI0027DAD038|nr:GNAT family N-acetyltransferase [Actinomadura barringtoniae]